MKDEKVVWIFCLFCKGDVRRAETRSNGNKENLKSNNYDYIKNSFWR